MAIELSNVMFTEQDDIVPPSGVEEIVINTGITNTLAGNDIINGGTNSISTWKSPTAAFNSAVYNNDTLNTADGNDIIMGRGACHFCNKYKYSKTVK